MFKPGLSRPVQARWFKPLASLQARAEVGGEGLAERALDRAQQLLSMRHGLVSFTTSISNSFGTFDVDIKLVGRASGFDPFDARHFSYVGGVMKLLGRNRVIHLPVSISQVAIGRTILVKL